METILNNAWVTGIGTGLISSIIVYFLTNFLLKKNGEKEYWDRVNKANIEFINYLRSYVLNNGVPSEVIFEAVRDALVREYGVKENHLYCNSEICEEFVIEIIGNTYVPNDNKIILLKKLEDYLEQSKKENESIEVSSEKNIELSEKFVNTISFISAIITIVSFILGTIL